MGNKPVDPIFQPIRKRKETNAGREYVLETNNLTKIYGQKEAAKDANCTSGRARFTA